MRNYCSSVLGFQLIQCFNFAHAKSCRVGLSSGLGAEEQRSFLYNENTGIWTAKLFILQLYEVGY